MLAPIKHLLVKKRIVLASGSPRRQELVHTIGLEAELCPSNFEENLNPANYNEFSEFIEATALGKAEEVFERLNNNENNDLLVIAADTMVTMNKEVFGKPKDYKDAVRMLTKLSGQCNRVYTGVVLKHKNGIRKFTETADVFFGDLSKEQIEAYVASGDPLDKAGSYGINGPGGALISKIHGDFYCVMGLPLHRLCIELCKFINEEAKQKR